MEYEEQIDVGATLQRRIDALTKERDAALFGREQACRQSSKAQTEIRSLTAENARLREAFNAAVAFIDSHAADPDITQEMRDRYADYKQKRDALAESQA